MTEKVLLITSFCFRLLRGKSVDETVLKDSSLKYWLKYSQEIAFPEEIKFFSKNKNRNEQIPTLVLDLNLFLDKDGILRCKGRMNKSNLTYSSKNPILLPRNSYFTNLIIRHYHNEVYHMGVNRTLSEIRKSYWIPKGCQVVKSLLDPCVTCKHINSRSFKTPSPPDLPKERVTLTRPFETTGIDYTGAVTIKFGDCNYEVYIVLFTCAVVEDLTAHSFLATFRRFCANYVMPSQVWTDNAKYFKSADGMLKDIFEIEEIKEHFAENLITWKNIPPKSPWYGSIWERSIQTMKNCLRKSIGNRSL